MSDTNREQNNHFMRKFRKSSAEAKDRRNKQLVEQQEIRVTAEKLQQQLLAIADLKAQIAAFQTADGAIAKITSDTNNTTDKISDEQYQTIITQKMIAHMKSKG